MLHTEDMKKRILKRRLKIIKEGRNVGRFILQLEHDRFVADMKEAVAKTIEGMSK